MRVQASAPSLQLHVLQCCEPKPLPDQPSSTTSPLAKVQLARAGHALRVQASASLARHQHLLQEFEPAPSPDQPTCTFSSPTMQPCTVLAMRGCGTLQSFLVQARRPVDEQKQRLQEFAPVSMPDQPDSTMSPPVSVHLAAVGVAVVGGGVTGGQPIFVQPSSPLLKHRQRLQ